MAQEASCDHVHSGQSHSDTPDARAFKEKWLVRRPTSDVGAWTGGFLSGTLGLLNIGARISNRRRRRHAIQISQRAS